MKKALSIILLLILAAASAQAQRYTRKKVAPEFFIPSRETTKREKLPPFPAWEEAKAAAAAAAEAKRQAAAQKATEATEAEELETDYDAYEPESEDEDIQTEPAAAPTAFGSTTRYLRNMAQYEEDLQQISQTGTMPENAELERDLQKMNSDELQDFPQ